MNIHINVNHDHDQQPTLTKAQQSYIIELLDKYVGNGQGKYQTGQLTKHFKVHHWTLIKAVQFMECLRLIEARYKNRAKPVKPEQESKPRPATHTPEDLKLYQNFKKGMESHDDIHIVAELLRTIKIVLDVSQKRAKALEKIKRVTTNF